MDKKVVTGQFSLNTDSGKAVNFLAITGDNEASQIFEHLGNNSTEYQTEYGLTRIGGKSGDKGRNMLGVNAVHEPGTTAANMAVFDNGYTIREAIHNHPNADNRSSKGDIDVANIIQGKFPDAKLYNYTQKYRYTLYNKNTPFVEPTIKLDEIIITIKKTAK